MLPSSVLGPSFHFFLSPFFFSDDESDKGITFFTQGVSLLCLHPAYICIVFFVVSLHHVIGRVNGEVGFLNYGV